MWYPRAKWSPLPVRDLLPEVSPVLVANISGDPKWVMGGHDCSKWFLSAHKKTSNGNHSIHCFLWAKRCVKFSPYMTFTPILGAYWLSHSPFYKGGTAPYSISILLRSHCRGNKSMSHNPGLPPHIQANQAGYIHILTLHFALEKPSNAISLVKENNHSEPCWKYV
jgi:hypothetical protein